MTEEEPVEVEFETRPLARANEVLPQVIHILPVAARPFFPGQGVPLLMDADPWRDTLKAIDNTEHHLVGLLLTRGDEAETARPHEFYSVGIFKFCEDARTTE